MCVQARDQHDIMVSKDMKERFLLQKRLAVCDAAVTVQQNQRSLKNISPSHLTEVLSVLVGEKVDLPLQVKAGLVENECASIMKRLGAEWKDSSQKLVESFVASWSPLPSDAVAFDAFQPTFSSLIKECMQGQRQPDP